jgi:TolB-like protein
LPTARKSFVRVCVTSSLTIVLIIISPVAVIVRGQHSDITKKSDTPSQYTLGQQLDNLAQQISNDLTENQKRTIAVVEFSDLKGNVTNFGRFLSEELITRLYQTKKFKVIERQQLNRIIAEQKLSLTGIVDPASAQKLGRVLGVDSIVFGSISDLVKTLRVNARLISAETGEVFAAASIEINKDEAVASLMNDGTSNSEGRRSSTSTPQQSSQKSVKVSVFRFELDRCKISSDQLNCWVNVTNESETDKNFIVYRERGTRTVDVLAREFVPTTVWLGNRNSNGDSFGNWKVGTTLVPAVPIRLVFVFKDVNSDLSLLRLLRISFTEDDAAKDRYADFRNIPITN